MRWTDIVEDDVSPNSKESEIAAALETARRRGIRVPDTWSDASADEIIALLHKAETNPTDTVLIPAGTSVEDIVALMLRKPSNAQ